MTIAKYKRRFFALYDDNGEVIVRHRVQERRA
jgi:hypothetical protein